MSGEPADIKADESALPEVRVYETPVLGGVARMLYTDQTIWEMGGEEELQKSFYESIKEPITVVVIAHQEIASDVLHPSYLGKEAAYLDHLFAPHLQEKIGDMPPAERQSGFWQKIALLQQGLGSGNSAFVIDNKPELTRLCAVNIDSGEARMFFSGTLGAGNAMPSVFKHELEHCTQNHPSDLPERLKMEAASDLASLRGEDAQMLNKLLFARSGIAFSQFAIEAAKERGLFSFGRDLNYFSHITSAVIDPKNGKIDTIDNEALKKSIFDLYEKVKQHVLPLVHGNLMATLLDQSQKDESSFERALFIARSAEKDIGTETAKLLPNRRISIHQEELYKDLSQNIKDRYDDAGDIQESVRIAFNKINDEDRKTLDYTSILLPSKHKNILEEMNGNGLAEKYPELTNALRESVIARENLVIEMRTFFETMKAETPEFYKDLITRPLYASILMNAKDSLELSNSKAASTAMYNALVEARQQGIFANDPIQQRVVDAFLNGVHSNPDSFNLADIKTVLPPQESTEATAAMPTQPAPRIQTASPVNP